MEKQHTGLDDGFQRLPQVIAFTGLCRAQIYEMVKNGEFPRPYRLSKRAIAWRESELRDWRDRREHAFDQAEAS